MDPASYRAGDADRERVAERLRVALEEGRLNLSEYDERLRDAFAARTYADLDALLADIPGTGSVVPATADQPVPWQVGRDGGYPDATRRWLIAQWDGWIPVVTICVMIWGLTSGLSGQWQYFWPAWVAGPWGALILAQTIHGLLTDEPQRWAAKRARRQAEREVRRRARGRGERE